MRLKKRADVGGRSSNFTAKSNKRPDWKAANVGSSVRERNHIAAAMLVWLSVKELADKAEKTIYQLKQGLLSDYLIQQMRNPTIAFS